jgi:hypothetical protein
MRFYNSSKIDLICRCHFGGGGGGTPPPMPKFEMPPMPKMPEVKPPPPPQERDMTAFNEASGAEREKAARREGFLRTVKGGETGGYSNPATGGSLLG